MRGVASISKVPAGTCTSRSLIFSEINFCSVVVSAIRSYREPTSASADLKGQRPFKCCSNSLRHFCTMLMVGSAAAKRAERAAQHIFSEIADEIDIFGTAIACVKTVQHFAQPGGAFAAGDAPAAGFEREKVHDVARHIAHDGVCV